MSLSCQMSFLLSNFWEVFFFGGNKCFSDVNASWQRWTRDKLELSEKALLFSCFDANFSKSSVCGSDVGGAKERERGGLIQFVQTIRGRHLICRLLSCFVFCICMLTWRKKIQKLNLSQFGCWYYYSTILLFSKIMLRTLGGKVADPCDVFNWNSRPCILPGCQLLPLIDDRPHGWASSISPKCATHCLVRFPSPLIHGSWGTWLHTVQHITHQVSMSKSFIPRTNLTLGET